MGDHSLVHVATPFQTTSSFVYMVDGQIGNCRLLVAKMTVVVAGGGCVSFRDEIKAWEVVPAHMDHFLHCRSFVGCVRRR